MFWGLNNLIKRYFAEILIVVGSGLFINGIFSFSSKTEVGNCPLHFSCRQVMGAAYYYDFYSLLVVSIGAMLIILGLLILRNKKR
jgi:hypothetical protein